MPKPTATLLLILALSAPAFAQPDPTLAHAIAYFNNFEDAKAKATLEQLLLMHPGSLDSAKAHVYLGLIAVNALDSNLARAEFLKALAIEPTVEVPFEASPKARLVFEQAQKQFSKESNQAAAANQPIRLQTQQVPLVVDNGPIPGGTVTQKVEPSSPSHAPAYVVGAIGLAAIGTGVGFGVWQNSTLKGVTDASQITGAQSQASTQGIVADICFGVGGVLDVISVVLFITESGSSSPDADKVTLRFSAAPGGASAALSF
jgi:hypothetical protein